MSDLHFVTGEFHRPVSTARDMADAARQARPDGRASASAPVMPGAELASLIQNVEEKCVDTRTVLGQNLDDHADSLDTVDRGFTATEEDNDQLMPSVIRGLGFGDVSER